MDLKKRKILILIKTNVDIRYGIISTINLPRLCHFDYNLVVVHCLCFSHGKLWETISQQRGTLCLTMKIFLCLFALLQSFISKICFINHRHAPFTNREIGCGVLTSQSSCFLAQYTYQQQVILSI